MRAERDGYCGLEAYIFPIVLGLVAGSVFVGCASDHGGAESANGGGGMGGATSCEDPADQECICGACAARGGVCRSLCPDTWECFEPGPLTEGQFSCGGLVNCDAYQVCVHGEGPGDFCETFSCPAILNECRATPSCACLADYIDEARACTDDDGHVELTYAGYVQDPPWDVPWCGDQTCVADEACWSCNADGGGGPRFTMCSVDDPSLVAARTCQPR